MKKSLKRSVALTHACNYVSKGLGRDFSKLSLSRAFVCVQQIVCKAWCLLRSKVVSRADDVVLIFKYDRSVKRRAFSFSVLDFDFLL